MCSSRSGRVVKRGKLHFDTQAQHGEDFTVKLPRLLTRKGYYINFDVVTTEDAPLLAKGHVIATEQFLLKEGTRNLIAPSNFTRRLSSKQRHPEQESITL